ncbi:MAG: glycoside hydrolase family 38 C-terminal domain-containing protein [Oenococcus sp.]|uniref:glycoside hydrolase family 38 N-terminal domain-containing protein n=1 Tax=Oenococcus TaxID=46254 RepID=UPI0021E739DA|nr:glycoside hydrolase family 38 C-terminal domain-containing protein [Oenococcus kitaharae]MCV3296583.1 alpha-mannosidase [Oenococcus kitaharae]
MVKEIDLVNHTHWDREWYFTTQDSQVLSEQVFTEMLEELTEHPEATFTLDGQTSILDEYISLHPEKLDIVRQLNARKQLFIGPWFTQTDGLIPDVESIIRNLVIGITSTRKRYGNPMMVGYLPDTFGFNAQMPTILNQVGIKNFLFWRGLDLKQQAGQVYFKWNGLGNQQVIAAAFPFGYFTGQITLESKSRLLDFVIKRYDPAAEFSRQNSSSETILMPSGIDQQNIIHNIADTVKKLNRDSTFLTKISSYPDFFKKLTKSEDQLPTYQGELRDPGFARVHRTIGSVRHQIKFLNFELEQKILRRVEPLAIIGRQLGIHVGNGLFIKLWKKLLECQPHDTLGGSISDNVVTDVYHRFKEANEIADGIENLIARKIAYGLNLTDHDLLIFNTDPFSFSGRKTVTLMARSKHITFSEGTQAEIINSTFFPKREHSRTRSVEGYTYTDEPAYWLLTVELTVQLPGLGYKVVHFQDSSNSLPEEKLPLNHNQIKNEYFSVSFEDGHLNLVDIKSNRRLTNFLNLLDSANDGDTYDYSPLKGDAEKTIKLMSASTEKSPLNLSQTLRVTAVSQLPYDLSDRLNPKTTKSFVCEISLTLRQSSPIIDTKIIVHNDILSHRLRLRLNSGIDSAQAHAMIQGGFVDTSNKEIAPDWDKKYSEKPVNIYNFDKIVGIRDSQTSFDVIVKGIKEYESRAGELFLTLMATTGELGKSNLQWRPGRASGDTADFGHTMMSTPLAQELGDNTFELGLLISTPPLDNNQLAQTAYGWLSPSISYQLQNFNFFVHRLDNKIWKSEYDPKHLPSSLSLLNINTSLSVTALYPAYTIPKAIILRLQNVSNHEVDISNLLHQGFKIINALEEFPSKTSQSTVGAFDLISLMLKK